MKDYRCKQKILPRSKVGLVESTRQRVRPEVNIKTREVNPDGGNVEVEAPIGLVDKITTYLEKIIAKKEGLNGITLNIQPFSAAYLKQGFPSIRFKWFLKHKKWVKILPRDAYTYLEYRFKDKNDEVY